MEEIFPVVGINMNFITKHNTTTAFRNKINTP